MNVSGPPCKPSEFRCDNGECIDESSVCDEHSDCRDLSDELNCSK